MNAEKEKHRIIKKERRIIKKATKRHATGDEVIFIFEKIIEGWKTIRIFNTIIQQNPDSHIDKKKVEQIATGNCKVDKREFDNVTEKYERYLSLREKVYALLKNKILTTNTENANN